MIKRFAFWTVVLILGLAGGLAAEDVYPVGIVVRTISDWTDVFFSGATVVGRAVFVVEGAEARGLQVSALSSVSIGKGVVDTTPIEVRIEAILAGLTADRIRRSTRATSTGRRSWFDPCRRRVTDTRASHAHWRVGEQRSSESAIVLHLEGRDHRARAS